MRGDGTAFTQLYDQCLARVYRHIAYRVASAADVEDLTQEVFLRAWRAIGGYKLGRSPFLAWLYTIAHNLVVDYYRKKGRQREARLEAAEMIGDMTQTEGLESVEHLDAFRLYLIDLPNDQQQVLMLRFVEGLDHATVAATLGKSEGAVRVIQLRALRRLRTQLEKSARRA